MPSAAYTEKWLKANHYHWFTAEVYEGSDKYPVYITEKAPILATIFAVLSEKKEAFLEADTLVRRQ